MNLNDILKITNGVNLNNSNLNVCINKISIDSRSLCEGDLFICIIGKSFDAHDYIEDAINKNVSGIIVSNDCNINTTIPIIKVENTLCALEQVAIYLKNKHNPITIAITGSNGKTTTKELMSNILSVKYNVLKNDENKNNIYGLCTTLFNLNNETEILVVELGMNHSGEIRKLSKICKPDIGIITNIGTSHIGYLNSRKNIFKAKLELKEGMQDGIMLVNGDDKYLKRVKKSYKCGKNSYNDLIAYNIYSNNDILSFNIFLDKEYQVRFNNPTKHFINDILLVIKTCLILGIDINTILNKISEYEMIKNRMNIKKICSIILIDDCYNSSFESAIGGLEYLKNIDNNKLIILGDILELGKFSKTIHKKINKYLKKIENKMVLTVGNYTKYIKGIHFENNIDLINYIKKLRLDNYYIYIKGSRLMHLEQVINYFENIY